MAGVSMAMNQSCYALKGKDDFPPLFVFSFTRYVIATMKKKASGAVFSALVTRDFEMEKVFEPNIDDANLFQKRVEPLLLKFLQTQMRYSSSAIYKTPYWLSYQASKLSFTRKEVSNKVIKDELLKLAEELFREAFDANSYFLIMQQYGNAFKKIQGGDGSISGIL